VKEETLCNLQLLQLNATLKETFPKTEIQFPIQNTSESLKNSSETDLFSISHQTVDLQHSKTGVKCNDHNNPDGNSVQRVEPENSCGKYLAVVEYFALESFK
jgi:hypothetical protein